MNEISTETTAANADVVDVATPEGTATPIDTAPTGNTTIPETAPVEQPITETQSFARRLAEKTAEAEKAAFDKVNATIAKLGGVTPEGNPIQTFEDLQRTLEYQEMQAEAAKQNVPVEILSRLTQAEKDAMETKNILSEYQRKEAMTKESEALSADKDFGEFFNSNKSKIFEIADKAKCDLDTAMTIALRQTPPKKVDETAIGNKAIQEYIEGKRTSYKPVEGSGAAPAQVVSTPKTYAEAREASKAYLRTLREQT